MAKKHSIYVCQQCGYESTGWMGKCPNCGTWGSLVETVEKTEAKASSKGKRSSTKEPIQLTKVPTLKTGRIKTNISELDRVLGGGLVAGQVLLLAGEPGIGKSTLLLQVANELKDVVYASGEESATQVKLRADRLGVKNANILFLEETDVDVIIESLEDLKEKPQLIIIDSIQTMATSDLSGMAGSVGQVRECAARALRWAKSNNVPLILVGHVTKQGAVAGPAVLAHLVDSVLWFEGDMNLALRLLRANKNRFGPTDEVGIFTMEQNGLVSVEDASKLFISYQGEAVAGSVVTSLLEGTRPVLVEIQSLVVSSKTPYPKRVTQGVDAKRVEMLLGILTRRCGLPLLDYDVYVNVAGGISVREPGADLAIALSIASSYTDKALPKGTIAVGELGLLGEIRSVPRQDKRIAEAKRQGYKYPITGTSFSSLRAAISSLLK